ncbi:MAG: patatin-like phospholipase family protein, partial [Bacteroidaceae bacterium]|nr:patatin-like phospholipase family protein [Bacteroidaceae bacterium]
MKQIISCIKPMIVAMLLLLSTTVKAQQTTTNSSTPNHPKVALVLGGGGAKGAAEVGVLKYIEQSEVPIDMIVGTSIGSIIGGLYSVGYSAQQLDSLFRSQEWTHLLTDHNAKHSDKIFEQEDGVTYFMGFPLNAKQKRDKTESRKSKFQFGMLRGDSIESLLSRMTALPDSIDFNTLPIPLRCVAVDISTLQEVVIQSGNLPRAMRASMAIPLAFKPINIDGH